MSNVYVSSRGSCLRLQDAIVTSVPGGRLSTLADEAFSSLNDIEGHKFVYFLCGIPDITFKYQEKGERNYEEVVFFNNNTAFNFKTLMYGIQSRFNSINCTPIFCTLPTINIKTWNNIRLTQHKTYILHYTHKYYHMQVQLNKVIKKINSFIISYNHENEMKTPHLHSTINRWCSRTKTMRYLYHKFVDGVHPSPELKAKWSHILQSAISNNL